MSVETLFIIAVILLVLEIFVPSMGIIGFGAFLSFVTGVVILIQTETSEFYGISIQAIIALGCLVFLAFACCGYFLFKSHRKPVETGVESMIGQKATVKSWSKSSGIVVFEGEEWRATSDDPLKSGDTTIIDSYTQMTLTVKKP